MKQIWVFSLLCLAACSGPTARYPVPQPEITETIGISFGSVEVRDVSLPAYAASDEISRETAEGALSSSSSVLWADAPDRAVSL